MRSRSNESNYVFNGFMNSPVFWHHANAIRNTLNSWPECSLTDSVRLAVWSALRPIGAKYRLFFNSKLKETFNMDLAMFLKIRSFIECPDMSRLIEVYNKLADSRKELFIMRLEIIEPVDIYNEVYDFSVELNDLLYDISNMTKGRILFMSDGKVDSIVFPSEELSTDRLISVKSLTEDCNAMLKRYYAVADNYYKYYNEMSGNIRGFWLSDSDYELLYILFSDCMLSNIDLKRIAYVLDRYNLFVEDREKIHHIVDNLNTDDPAVFERLYAIIEQYYFNEPLSVYNKYCLYCQQFSSEPSAIFSFASLSELISRTNRLQKLAPEVNEEEPNTPEETRKNYFKIVKELTEQLEELKRKQEELLEMHDRDMSEVFKRIDD